MQLRPAHLEYLALNETLSMLQQETADDYVIATGVIHAVRDLV